MERRRNTVIKNWTCNFFSPIQGKSHRRSREQSKSKLSRSNLQRLQPCSHGLLTKHKRWSVFLIHVLSTSQHSPQSPTTNSSKSKESPSDSGVLNLRSSIFTSLSLPLPRCISECLTIPQMISSYADDVTIASPSPNRTSLQTHQRYPPSYPNL